MNNAAIELSPSEELGMLGIAHLKRFWQKHMAKRQGFFSQGDLGEEWRYDITLLSVLGLGLEQALSYLYNETPSLETFEEWVLKINNGRLPADKVAAFNSFIIDKQEIIEPGEDTRVLTAEDLEFWDKNGYVIVRNAVCREDCEEVVKALCDFINVRLNEPETWYSLHPKKQGIMVQMFQHPAMQRNRVSARIRGAFEQLWGRKDLWVTADRVGFNPPETRQYKFPGPYLHWDVSLDLPIPFSTQGILYLTDTAAHQGAFTLVPGFQHRIDKWIGSLPAGANPREQDLYALGAEPIAANGGDFIIWHQALPHGSSPNTAEVPRIVQYINYLPVDIEIKDKWK